jgi:hypothetical protein
MQKGIEIIAAVAIVAVAVVGYVFGRNLVTGVYEPSWAYQGIEFTNKSVMLLFIFAVSGGGIVWMVRRKVTDGWRRTLLSVIGVVGVAMLMALSSLLRAILPFLVMLYIVAILADERKKRRKEKEAQDG